MHGAGCVYVNVAMRARDQSYIFSTGEKFCPDYGLLLELHALTLVARSYALLQSCSYASYSLIMEGKAIKESVCSSW